MSKYKPGDIVAVRGEVYLSGGALAVGLCPEGSGFGSAVRLAKAEVVPWDAEHIAKLRDRIAKLETELCAAQSDMEWCRDHSRDAHEHDEAIDRAESVLNPSAQEARR
jgi:chromosome segregation ATPase